MELGLSGLASGFDWNALVDQLTEVERAPQRRWRNEQFVLGQRNQAYSAIAAQLATFQERAAALQDASLFDSRSVRIGDTTLASGATADPGTALGSYTFNFTQLATASVYSGSTNIGRALSLTDDVSALVLSDAAFASAVTAGTFTVNGQQVTVETSDTLQAVFDKISTATGGLVTGNYDSATDQITLSSAGAIVLGSATDTSNLLTVAKLHNNGTGTVTSAYALGAIDPSVALAAANFGTAVSDGGAGAGEFKVNGVSISFDAAVDTFSDVLARINNSAAGVTASYDPTRDRVVLTNKVTGDIGVAVEDVTGTFVAAAGLDGGMLTRGKNLLYTVNGGDVLTSQTNTITGASSGLTGLTLTALAEGSTTVEVASDTARIKTAITDFVSEYNKAQSLIDNYTASSTDAEGKVTAGLLAGQSDAYELGSRLRSAMNAAVSGLGGTVTGLSALGFTSNGNDDQLAVGSGSELDTVLANNLAGVRSLFADATNGLGVRVSAYLETVVGEEGALVTRQSTLTKQIADIDTQVSDQERLVQANRQSLINSFLAMERAQAQINQQLQFLAQRFGTSA